MRAKISTPFSVLKLLKQPFQPLNPGLLDVNLSLNQCINSDKALDWKCSLAATRLSHAPERKGGASSRSRLPGFKHFMILRTLEVQRGEGVRGISTGSTSTIGTSLHRWGWDINYILCSVYPHCLSQLVSSNRTPIHLFYLFLNQVMFAHCKTKVDEHRGENQHSPMQENILPLKLEGKIETNSQTVLGVWWC